MGDGILVKTNCPHCNFIFKLFPREKIAQMIDEEYSVVSQLFDYLHHGNNYCDYDEKRT